MKRFRTTVIIGILVALFLNSAFAEEITYSDDYIMIRQAEQAIQDHYQITPDMYTFFIRNITISDDETVTVTLTGNGMLYWVLGTYTGTSDGNTATASWSNEGKQTYGGFDAEAWDALQLHQMLEITRKEHSSKSFFSQAVNIARRDDPDYNDSTYDISMVVHEHEFELTVPHPDHLTIEEKSKYTRDQLNEIAKVAIADRYGFDELLIKQLFEIESEPDFRYEIIDGQLIFHAWLGLQQDETVTENRFTISLEHDGQYLVIINAETGTVEDILYDACLIGEG